MISKITIETDLVSLNEVLNQTGNPEVAVQILNGTYQEPEISKADRASSPDRDGERKQYTFVSYNKWKDEVKYKNGRGWTDEMDRNVWEKLDLWIWHISNEEKVDDVVDTEHGI